jgi:hypothetical protein
MLWACAPAAATARPAANVILVKVLMIGVLGGLIVRSLCFFERHKTVTTLARTWLANDYAYIMIDRPEDERYDTSC